MVSDRNELLAAVDLRLTALKKEVASAFNQAIGSESTPKDVSDIKNFTFHFGNKNLRYLSHLLPVSPFSIHFSRISIIKILSIKISISAPVSGIHYRALLNQAQY